MAKMRVYTFTIPQVFGKMRPRAFALPAKKGGKTHVRVYDPKENQQFESLVKMEAHQAGVQLLDRCIIGIRVVLPVRVTPRKTMDDKIHEPLKRPDIDNIIKAVMDGLNGIAYKDDKHVLKVVGQFRFTKDGQQALTRVAIQEVRWEDYILDGE